MKVNGEKQTARLLLLDTTESVSQRIPPQRMGKAASSFIKKQLKGKSVTLVYDRGLKEEKYGRKLAYVFFEGIHINRLMVKSGYGIVAYISKPNTTLLSQMLESEKEAKTSKTGVWSIKGFVDEKNHHAASKYFHLGLQAKRKFFEEGALK